MLRRGGCGAEFGYACLQIPEGNVGVGFAYTIGAGGTAIRELLRKELIDWLPGQDASRISLIQEHGEASCAEEAGKEARADPSKFRIESNRVGKGAPLQGIASASGANLTIRDRQT